MVNTNNNKITDISTIGQYILKNSKDETKKLKHFSFVNIVLQEINRLTRDI